MLAYVLLHSLEQGTMVRQLENQRLQELGTSPAHRQSLVDWERHARRISECVYPIGRSRYPGQNFPTPLRESERLKWVLSNLPRVTMSLTGKVSSFPEI
jgi:hypothetical protein